VARLSNGEQLFSEGMDWTRRTLQDAFGKTIGRSRELLRDVPQLTVSQRGRGRQHRRAG
jgi:hypothetical protein